MLSASSHPDLPTIFTQLLTRTIYLSSHASKMADASCRGSLIHKPGHQSRRRQRSSSLRRGLARQPRRHDSATSIDSDASSYSSREPPNVRRGRSRSRRRGAEDFEEWASRASQSSINLPTSLPIYEPKPLLHREDAFKVVEEAVTAMEEMDLYLGLETDHSTEYDSDELEFCTTQFPEFGEGCIYDFRP